jgi:putative hemolysin
MDSDVSFTSIFIRAALFLVSLLSVGFFAGAETAFLAMDKWVIDSLAREGDRRAKLLKGMKRNSKNTLSAVLVGTNVFTILASVTALSIAYSLEFKGPLTVAIVSLVTTAFVFVFSELVPKTYAAKAPTSAALSVALLLDCSVKVLSPVSYLMGAIPSMLTSILSRRRKETYQKPESEVLAVFEMAEEEGYVKPEDKDVVDSVFNSKDKKAIDVFMPLKNVVTYRPSTTLREGIDQFREHRYSRVPILSDSEGRIIGVLYIKDAIREIVSNPQKGSLPVTAVMRPVYFVQADDSILRVFSTLKRDKVHMAVVAQRNLPLGIITMDDLLEELVGEIPEEHYSKNSEVSGKAYSSSRVVSND